MKKLLIVLLAAFSFTSSAGNVPDIEKHLKWIASNTVEFKDAGNIPKESYPSYLEMSKKDFHALYGEDTEATYLTQENKVVTYKRNKKSKWIDGIMIHELTHFVQINTKERKYNCAEEYEREAFAVQIRYMKQHNVEFDTLAFASKLYLRCNQ